MRCFFRKAPKGVDDISASSEVEAATVDQRSEEFERNIQKVHTARLELEARRPEIRDRVDQARRIKEVSMRLHASNHFGESIEIAMRRKQ